MRYKKCLVLSATLFFCLIINCLMFGSYSTRPIGWKLPVNRTPLENINFRYLIHNEQCTNSFQPYIVLLITSFSGNVKAREAIRRAYSLAELKRLNIVRVFLLAKLKKGQSKINQNVIYNESSKFGDVLLGDFFEAYKNLTYKHMMGLKWASEACPNARYIAKMDDDIVVDLYKLSEIISMEENRHNITLMGYFFGGMAVNREKNNKWYVTRLEYSEDYYPAFLSGWLYVTTPSVATILISTSRHVPFFWIDDVYITGLLAREANIVHQNISQYFSQFTEYIHCCIRDKLACNFVAGPSNGYYAMHNSFRRWTDDCKRGLCKALISSKPLKDSCTINWQLPIDRGKSLVQQIQILI